MTNKFQIPKSSKFKTIVAARFGILNFRIWRLFEFWHLGFGFYLTTHYSNLNTK